MRKNGLKSLILIQISSEKPQIHPFSPTALEKRHKSTHLEKGERVKQGLKNALK